MIESLKLTYTHLDDIGVIWPGQNSWNEDDRSPFYCITAGSYDNRSHLPCSASDIYVIKRCVPELNNFIIYKKIIILSYSYSFYQRKIRTISVYWKKVLCFMFVLHMATECIQTWRHTGRRTCRQGKTSKRLAFSCVAAGTLTYNFKSDLIWSCPQLKQC